MDNHDPKIQSEALLKSAAELIAANQELAFQYAEKEKRANELAIANKELAFQNEEKERKAAELVIANEELLFQNAEKEKRAAELLTANLDLKEAQQKHIVHIRDLEDMMFMISHKVRQPVTNIMGLSELLDLENSNPDELKKLLKLLKESGQLLEDFTNELSAFIHAKIESQIEG